MFRYRILSGICLLFVSNLHRSIGLKSWNLLFSPLQKSISFHSILPLKHQFLFIHSHRHDPVDVVNHGKIVKSIQSFVFTGIGSFFLSSSMVFAQIPSMDEFYQTSGTVVVNKQSNSGSVVSFQPYTIEDINSAFVKDLKSSIESLQTSIQRQDWDNVIKIIKKYKIVSKNYFGLSGIDSLASKLSVSDDRAEKIESIREDLSFSLGQLSDYARSHRIIYFNKEDMKLIKVITTGDEDGIISIQTSDGEDATEYLTTSLGLIDNMIRLAS